MSFIKKTLKKTLSVSSTLIQKADELFEDGPSSPPKSAAQQLRPLDLSPEEESRRKALLDDIPVGLYRTTLDGRILDANVTMVEMLGYPDRETLLHTCADECYVKSAERRRFEALVAEKSVVKDFETRLQRWDGRVIWVRDSCAEVRDEDDNLLYYQGSLQDITETKLAQQALKESEERYRNLIERQGDGLGIVDETETFTFTNTIAEEIFGLAPGKLVGRNLKEFMSRETFEAIREQTSHRRAGARSTYDVEIVRADGKKRSLLCTATPWFDRQGSYAGAFAIFHDDTEHQQAVKALKQSEEKYRAVMNQSAECIFLLEPKSKSILEANAALRRLLGYTKEEMRTLSVNDFVAHSSQDIETQIGRVQSSRSHFLGERRYRHKDGRIVYVEVNASLISFGGKDVLCLVSRDITERKQAAEALKESEERLRRSQRLDAVGRLAGGVAHDFNNLMAGILGCTEILLQRTPQTDPLRKQMKEIHSSAERAASLTQQLLSFSRRRSIRARKVGLNTIIVEMDNLLARMVGKKTKIHFDLHNGVRPIRADRSQMEQILLNLVHNAGDAMPQGGTIYVATRNVDVSPEQAAQLAYSRPGAFVELEVKDEGEGMPEEVKERVFDPFFTTKEQGKGTGLGLSTVYGIVKNHQGWVAVESSPGQGAAFSVYLPAEGGRAPQGSQKEGEKDPAKGPSLFGKEKLCVLIVDNHTEMEKKAVEQLSTRGFDSDIAASAAEAVTMLEEWTQQGASPKRPWGLVLANLSLPDESGVRLADELRTRLPSLPILLCGTFSPEVARLTTIGEKGYGYLQRPFEAEDLFEAMRETLHSEKGPSEKGPSEP